MKLKDLAIGVADQFKIDPRKIMFMEGYNIRQFDSAHDPEDMELKASIKENGVRQTLTVRLKDEVIYVVAGHRRLSAVKELLTEGHPIDAVPCVAEARYATEEDRDADLLISNQHKLLTPLQKGEWMKRMMTRHGWTEEKAAQKIGLSTKQVGNLLVLASADPTVKEMVSKDEVSATEAIKTVRREGDKAGAVLAEAKEVAREAGKARVTAKTNPSSPSKVATNSVLASLGVAPQPEPVAVSSTRPRIVQTAAKFKELVDTLYEVLELDDVKLIHTMVRDTLGAKSKAA